MLESFGKKNISSSIYGFWNNVLKYFFKIVISLILFYFSRKNGIFDGKANDIGELL